LRRARVVKNAFGAASRLLAQRFRTWRSKVKSKALPLVPAQSSHCCLMSPRAAISRASCSACRCGYGSFRSKAWIASGPGCPRM